MAVVRGQSCSNCASNHHFQWLVPPLDLPLLSARPLEALFQLSRRLIFSTESISSSRKTLHLYYNPLAIPAIKKYFKVQWMWRSAFMSTGQPFTSLDQSPYCKFHNYLSETVTFFGQRGFSLFECFFYRNCLKMIFTEPVVKELP